MKRRSREVQTFSMSALDLFASALGAFILITMVLFPFFPHTGNAKENAPQLKMKLDQANTELAETQAQLQAARLEIGRAKNKSLDLVIALDVTGSMGDEITGIQDDLDTLIRVLGSVFSDVSVGIVAYGDRTDAGKHPVHGSNATLGVTIESGLLPIEKGNPNVGQLQGFVRSLSPSMGLNALGVGTNRDLEEAVKLALERSIGTIEGGHGQQRTIVLIGDNPAYPEEVEAALALGREFAAREGNRISTIYVKHSDQTKVPNAASAEAFMQELARQGRGKMVGRSASLIADIVESVLR